MSGHKPVTPQHNQLINAEAIASGRPVAARDVDCAVRDMPFAHSRRQELANAVANKFLESWQAACPDRGPCPYCSVNLLVLRSVGRLIARIDQALNRVPPIEEESQGMLVRFASSTPDALMDGFPTFLGC